MFRHDPVIGYRFVPNIKGRVRHEGGGYLVRANREGFRNDREFAKQRPNGQRRILVFGDSNTAGDGVSNGKRFSDAIEQQLAATEVYNFGLPSSGTDQQYLAYREVGAALEHDMVLLCPMVDNIRRNLQEARIIQSSMAGGYAELPKPYFALGDTGIELRNVPVPKGHKPVEAPDCVDTPPQGLRSFARLAMEKADSHVPGLRSWSQRVRRLALPADYNDPASDGWRIMDGILRQWIAEAQAPVVLAPIPTFEHIFGNLRAEPYRTRFAELAADTGVEFLDILPGLRAASMDERRAMRFPTDEHPTVAGHQAIADQMIPALEAALSSENRTSA